MTYNVHPLFVHFPIALLFLYSVIKILPFQKFSPNVSWKYVLRTLVFFGALAAVPTIITGVIAKSLVHPNEQLVTAHASFALLSFAIYSVLLAIEFIPVFKIKYENLPNGIMPKVLAFLGLVSITITGMLGGVMVYGLTADPIAPFVLKLLGINL